MKYFKYLIIVFFIMSSINLRAESNDLSYKITKNLTMFNLSRAVSL
jgi:hypothetical protein